MDNAHELLVEEPKINIERGTLTTLVKVETLAKVVSVTPLLLLLPRSGALPCTHMPQIQTLLSTRSTESIGANTATLHALYPPPRRTPITEAVSKKGGFHTTLPTDDSQ
jgi:hypothetical protein